MTSKRRRVRRTARSKRGHPRAPRGSCESSEEQRDTASRLRPWRKRFADQFVALCAKQALVYWRNWLSTLLRVLSPLVFMFLLWMLDIAFRTDNQNLSAYLDNPVAGGWTCQGRSRRAGRTCSSMTPATTFCSLPIRRRWRREIVENIRLKNPGRAIPEGSVIGFESMEAANAYLASQPGAGPRRRAFPVGRRRRE